MLVLGLVAFALVTHNAYRSLSAKTTEQTAPAGIRRLPPGLELEALDGKKVPLAGLTGKVVVLNFWAGWCAPCLNEMPGLYAFYRRLENNGLAVLAVNMDEDPNQGLDVLTKKVGKAPFPVYKGAESELAEQFEIGGLPFTVVVGRDGDIVYSRAGEIDWTNSDAATLIEEIL